MRNRRMPNGTYGGVRGRKTKVGGKTTFVFLLLDSVVFLSGEEPGNGLAVFGVFRVFSRTDFLCQGGTAEEEYNQQQRANDAPVENAHTGADGEDIQGAPGTLFTQVVGVTAVAPETVCVESFVVRSRQLLQFLARVNHLPLGGLEGPLLLVGNGLVGNEIEHEGGGKDIYPAKWDGGVHAHQGREGGHQDQHILNRWK